MLSPTMMGRQLVCWIMAVRQFIQSAAPLQEKRETQTLKGTQNPISAVCSQKTDHI